MLASVTTVLAGELAYGSHTPLGLRPIVAATRRVAYGSTRLRRARLRLDRGSAASRLRLHRPTAGSLRSTRLRRVTALRAAADIARILSASDDRPHHRTGNGDQPTPRQRNRERKKAVEAKKKATRNENHADQKTATVGKKKRTLQTKPNSLGLQYRARNPGRPKPTPPREAKPRDNPTRYTTHQNPLTAVRVIRRRATANTAKHAHRPSNRPHAPPTRPGRGRSNRHRQRPVIE